MADEPSENSPLDIEENTEEVRNSNSDKKLHLWNLKRFKCVLTAIISILLVVGVVVIVLLCHTTNSSTDKSGNKSFTAGLVKTSHGLLIDQNICNVDTCKKCEQQFSVDYIPFEAKNCDCGCGNCNLQEINATEDCECEKCNPKVKNATCFMCNDVCLTPDDIVEHWNISDRLKCSNSAPVRITCCLIARMKNLDRPDGTYKCYEPDVHEKYNVSNIQPLYHCQNGTKGQSCEQPNEVPFHCQCYTYTHDFLKQKEMKDCNSIPSTSYCHTTINARKCVCHRRNETESRLLNSC